VPSGTRVELKTRRKDGNLPEHVMDSILSKVRGIDGVTSAEWASATAAPAAAFPIPGIGGWGGPPAMAMGKPMPGQFPGPSTTPAEGEDGPMLRLYSESAGEVAVRAAQILLDADIELADMHLYTPGLEDVFIHLTGKGLRN